MCVRQPSVSYMFWRVGSHDDPVLREVRDWKTWPFSETTMGPTLTSALRFSGQATGVTFPLSRTWNCSCLSCSFSVGNPAPQSCIHKGQHSRTFTCLMQPDSRISTSNKLDKQLGAPPTSFVILLLRRDGLKGSDKAGVNTLFLTVIFSEMQPVSSVKGPRD